MCSLLNKLLCLDVLCCAMLYCVVLFVLDWMLFAAHHFTTSPEQSNSIILHHSLFSVIDCIIRWLIQSFVFYAILGSFVAVISLVESSYLAYRVS